MTEIIMRLRKCAEELSQIADAMAQQMNTSAAINPEELEKRVGVDAKRVVEVLAVFGINVKVEKVQQGPTLNKIELSLPPGCRYSSITSIADNLQGALKKRSVRIEAPIPGSDTIGIEYDREDPEPVTFANAVLPELKRMDALRKRPYVPVVVGKNTNCRTASFDLASMSHLLVGGAIGQGKSMFFHSLINGLITSRSPEEVRLILFDQKSVEYTAYENLPHLVVPVITDCRKVMFSLKWAVVEMEKRLKTFANIRVRNIQDYNSRKITADEQFQDIPESLPYIVIVLDEIANLMMECGKEVVPDLCRLTTKAQSTGIHLVMATQCADCNVVTGTLKANIPGRMAFKTAISMDSRVLIDEAGSECLIGKGDCLYKNREGILERVQTPFISDEEIAANVKKAIEKYSASEYKQKAERQLDWGYNKAAEIFDEVEKH